MLDISNYGFWWMKQCKFEIWKVCIIWLLRFRYYKIGICGKNSNPLCTFCNISVNFEDAKMVDHIFKIPIPSFFDNSCLSWNNAKIVFMKKMPLANRRRYKWCHWIPMFIGTPRTYKVNFNGHKRYRLRENRSRLAQLSCCSISLMFV